MFPPSGVSGWRLVRFNHLNDERDVLVRRLDAFRAGNVHGPRFDELQELAPAVVAWAERAREFFPIDVPHVNLEAQYHSEILQALTACIEPAGMSSC